MHSERAAASQDALSRSERAAIDELDVEALVRDLGVAVSIPSITGDEAAVIEAVASMADELSLKPRIHRDDINDIGERTGFPGGIVPRNDLVSLTATLDGPPGCPRLCINGHLDVVDPGTIPWSFDPWSGGERDGWILGRGSVDMKGGVIAAVHALGAIRRAGGNIGAEVVLQAVPSEEDGGAGTFAALERDDRFDACLIPEPTALSVVCAHAGVQQFAGTIRGRSAHAAMRLEGHSALDRYVQLHLALQEYERKLNSDVAHPLMRELRLPYPIAVGKLSSGIWASQVPDRLDFEGRFGIRVAESRDRARESFQSLVARVLDDGEAPPELRWTGGFESGATDPDHPFAELTRQAATDELGDDVAVRGEPYGADMWQFCSRGIPCVMFGPRGIELAHGVDERVRTADLVAVARTIIRVVMRAPQALAADMAA